MIFSEILVFSALFIKIVKTDDVKFIAKNSSASGEARLLPVIPPAPPLAPSILFPVNAATGILCAIAVPVPLPDQNVFVSYNFEANYNMANVPSDSIMGWLTRLKATDAYPEIQPNQDASDYDIIARKLSKNEELSDDVDDVEDTTTSENISETHDIQKRDIAMDRIIFTRVGVYQMIVGRLDANFINGKKCLLMAICESAKIPFAENNGVLGSVLHIILTPSASADENLPSEYFKAEKMGRQGDCSKYEKACNFNVLDLFSTIL